MIFKDIKNRVGAGKCWEWEGFSDY